MQIDIPQNFPVFGMSPAQDLSLARSSVHSANTMQLPQGDPLTSALVSIVSRVLDFALSLVNRLSGGNSCAGSSSIMKSESPFQPLADLGSSLLDGLAKNGDDLLEKAVSWLGGGIGKVAGKIGGFLSKLF